MKNYKGFSVLEGLLILVIVGLIGGTGWYVWKVKTDSNKSLDSASQTEITAAGKKKEAKPVDATADWESYSNSEGKFSLKHPKTWVKATNPELCNPGLLLIGANANSVGKCATESFGQMSVASVEGDSSKEAELKSGYTSITKQTVTVEGISGVLMTGTASAQEAEGSPGALADGTKVTKYIFYTNSRTYTATYIAASSYPDALSDFNLMVTKTLKFSS